MADILDKRPVDAEMTIFKTEVDPNKLNACIDNILMRLDRLETSMAKPVNRWISVKDRLPNEGETVLIYAPRTQNQYYIAMFYTLRDEIKFAMNIYGVSYCWYAEDVTHWQPLPQSPQD